jgi:hypothetical protein
LRSADAQLPCVSRGDGAARQTPSREGHAMQTARERIEAREARRARRAQHAARRARRERIALARLARAA